jgi:hypothetical protein
LRGRTAAEILPLMGATRAARATAFATAAGFGTLLAGTD